MDGSAAPKLLLGILIQGTAFPSPCDSSDLLSELSGMMNLCPANLNGGCYIFVPWVGTRLVTGTCCMLIGAGCFCLQGLHFLPGSSCHPATVTEVREASPQSSCWLWEGGLVCKERSQGLALPCHPENLSGVSLEKWARAVWDAAVCFCTVGSLFLINFEYWVNLAGD